jgi:DNA-directed RNA polymerase subunit F|tara:strand:+ start:24 stop:350 length:327 start_codon:yes stop_codon:yes gene_type:complete
MEEIKKKQAVSLSEVKELLKNQDPENMDQIQRWTFDYVSKVSNLEFESAKKMRQELVKECKLTEEEAVEIVNICPQTMSELRSFTFGWKKLILTETLEKILKIIKANS